MSKSATLESVVGQAMQLSLQDKLRLIARIVSTLEHEVASPKRKPLRSARGILAHLGPAPSAEEIDEARREAWGQFPREDIA